MPTELKINTAVTASCKPNTSAAVGQRLHFLDGNIMRHTPLPRILPSEITDEHLWTTRREWLQRAGLTALAVGTGSLGTAAYAAKAENNRAVLPATRNAQLSVDETLTAEEDVISYNNFYEFGTDKSDPERRAHRMESEPWTVRVEGEVLHPRTYDIDDLRKLAAMEERIYRLRCVEGWSMVIPWIGYSLSHVLNDVQPTGNAKYVEFITAQQGPNHMPGVRRPILDWPYTEGLRLDEAMHPLTMLVFGVYGKLLPNQNGAPMRVAVPWKYGFKSGKSIVTIRLRSDEPQTSWVKAAPHEYGFYANVNPEVPHPRWSQATERRIGGRLFGPRTPTQMFNGYGEAVASLYAGMDLARYY